MEPKKRGWKTSEFWISLGTIVGAVGTSVAGALPASVGAVVAGIAAAGYAVARGLAKAFER